MKKNNDDIDRQSLIDEIVNVKLSNNHLMHLLQTLDFAQRAASALYELELGQNNLNNAKQMKTHGNNAIQLCEIIHKNLDIGEPLDDTVN